MCQICYSPFAHHAVTIDITTFGVGSSSVAAAETSNVGPGCKGETYLHPATETSQFGFGDYINIPNAQTQPGTATLTAAAIGIDRICGAYFTATAAAVVHNTVCSFSVPFRLGVHFDDDEAIIVAATAAEKDHHENHAPTVGSGFALSGFHLSYWQVAC